MASRLDAELRTWQVGDTVRVRSLDAILETLDDNGELDGLPFMPEMIPFCGRTMEVHKVAHKLCDTVSRSGMRRMNDAVHLVGARCDGGAHAGCQAACLLYWKTAWLEAVDDAPASTEPADQPAVPVVLQMATRRPPVDGEERYRCQATELTKAAPEVLPLREPSQYVDDIRSGNATVLEVARAFTVGVYNHTVRRLRPHLPASLQRRVPDGWRAVPGRPGRTPTGRLDLQPGELVRVRSRSEVSATLNEQHLNRGLGFDAEMARFCGQTARVAGRVERIIDEGTGRMLEMKEPCIRLDGIVCEGAYNASCPRSITPYWRELWLERVDPPGSTEG